jgi:probable HAF family extracellular repeat protein/YD repeat-containing protein
VRLLLEALEDRYLPSGYTIVDLGTLGGPNSTSGRINNSGEVVGQADTASGASHAFLYDGSMHDLGTFGGNTSYAFGINDSGQVVGGADLAGDKVEHAFMYDGSLHDLGTLGGTSSGAYSINNSGQIVGASQDALLWQNGTITDLGADGGMGSIAFGINNSGQVAGVLYLGTQANVAQRAFLYDGSMHDLGTLGGDFSQSDDINDSGQVVGYSKLANNTTYNAFLYDGSMHALGTLGGWFSQASAINDLGQIVGFSNIASGRFDAFLYENGTMIDLNSLLPAGSDFSYLHYATGINDRGQIVGSGITTGGQTHDYLLTPLNQPTLNVKDGGTYTSNPMSATATAVGTDGKTAVVGSFTYNYYVGSNTSGTNLGASAPTNAGTYTVVATFTSNDSNYASGGTVQTTFTITPAPLTVTAIALNKPADGTTTAYVILSDNHLGHDQLTVTYSPTFSDASQGNGKTVTVSGISISGTAAGNYSLQNTTATATANITAAGSNAYTYDSQHRLIGIVFSNGNVYERTYALDGSSTATLQDGNGNPIETINYFSSGQINTIVLANGNTLTYGYTSGVHTQTVITDPNNKKIETINYSLGQISTIVLANGETLTYGYTSGVHTTTAITDQNNNPIETITYNSSGQISSIALANGNTLTYGYTNGVHTQTTITAPSSGNTTPPTLETINYDSSGQITSIVSGSNGNTLSYTYNNGTLSKVTLTGSTANGQATLLTETYTSGQLSTVVLANGDTLTYGYNSSTGVLTSAQLTDSNNHVLANYSYSSGQLANISDANNNPIESFMYDSQGRVSTITYGLGAGSTMNGNVLTYTYNNDGTSSASLVSSSNAPISTTHYDVYGRVIEIDYANGNTYKRQYDPTNGTSTATLKNSSGQTIETYTYDAQGNLVSHNP